MKLAIDFAARQAILNEYGETDRLLRLWTPPVNPHAARRAELHAIIQSWYVSLPAAETASLDSKQYHLDVKPCQFQRDMGPAAQAKAFRAFQDLDVIRAVKGKSKLVKFDPFEVFSTTQAAITSYLGEAFLDEIAPKQRTGQRTFSVVAKAAPSVSKAA